MLRYPSTESTLTIAPRLGGLALYPKRKVRNRIPQVNVLIREQHTQKDSSEPAAPATPSASTHTSHK